MGNSHLLVFSKLTYANKWLKLEVILKKLSEENYRLYVGRWYLIFIFMHILNLIRAVCSACPVYISKGSTTGYSGIQGLHGNDMGWTSFSSELKKNNNKKKLKPMTVFLFYLSLVISEHSHSSDFFLRFFIIFSLTYIFS